MLVDLTDGHCRECHGQLEIEEVTDATMHCCCTQCGASFEMEPDAFGDGCLKYFVPMQVKQEGSDRGDHWS